MALTSRGTPFSRRSLLGTAGGALAAASIAGCQLLSTDPSESTKSGDSDKHDKESPMLAEQIAAGKLPPLKERLPKSPLVVEPVERVGVYGGEWQSVVKGAANLVMLYMTIGYEQLVHWDPNFSGEVVPNVAEEIETSDDASQFTFHLREGMKWSDGKPFTADDILFAYNDVLLNGELIGSVPLPLTLAGKPAELERVDDYTIRFVFPGPHGLFLQHLATPSANMLTAWPKHYLERFHKTYNPDADQLAKDEGFETWVELFDARGTLGGKYNQWMNADLPTINPWRVVTPFGEGTRVATERNPYYFKTDPEGRQLPYLDRVVFDVAESDEVALLKAGNGELHMDVFNVNALQHKPVLASGRAEGGYDFFDTKPTSMNYMMISLNLCHEDPVKRELFQNLDFRIGLSYAINRQELIDVVFQRQGQPWQGSPRPESEFHDEELAAQYLAYDVDKANEHLDRAGFGERDSEGFRLGPDGKRIRFAVEVAIGADFELEDAVEMVHGNWQDVGIDMQVKSEDRSLLYERKAVNKHDAVVWLDKMGLHDAVLDPRWYFPYSGESNYAIPWATWFATNGAEGEEPVEAARRQMELYAELQGTPDREGRKEVFMEILEIAKEEFWAIGTVLPAQGFGIVRNDFHNVMDPMPEGWMYPSPGPSRPEQYFIE